jgi:hypothetical protein
MERQMNRSAIISPCGDYRHSLTREEASLFESRGTVLFCLNNPSTADAEFDDPTVLRGWGYARTWGYHRMVFVNTNPYRSPDPDSAIVPPEHILLENDKHLRAAAGEADLVICAWGGDAYPELAARALNILRELRPLHILELSIAGIPKHPLYLKGSLLPTLWNPAP